MTKKTKRKKDNKTLWWIISIVALVLFIQHGTNEGWFDQLTLFSISGGGSFFQSGGLPFGFPTDPESATNTAGYDVKLEIIPNSICSGDMVTGRITSNMPNALCAIYVSINNNAWQPLTSVMLDANGFFEDSDRVYESGEAKFITLCCDTNINCKISNVAPLSSRDCSTPPSFNVGDVVGGGSGSGTLTGDSSSMIQYFDLSDVSVGGDCYLGAKLNIEWDFQNSNDCDYMQGIYQGVLISFLDSSGVVWDTYSMNPPQTIYKEFCPLYWDGATPWKLMIGLSDPELTPNCKIDYTYDVEIFVCYCP
jgi:hypothetical protein